MGVPATELRPRGPVALFDAALRLCARSAGAWALTLPAGALLTLAVLHLVEALQRHESLALPALWLTLAWLFRGVCQGATCHHLEGLLLSDAPPGALGSLRAAFSRLPTLIVTAVYLPVFNALMLSVTLGVGYFLLASHLAAWAAVMKGKGHPLNLYATCARMLGQAKGNATTVRLLFWVGALVALNLHIGANVLLYLARKLLGLDLVYAQRLTSMDNGAWMAVVAVVTFVLFEPVRAAVATLLLIDGRVRQEGLDLLASVEQLPTRNADAASARRRRSAAAAGVAALIATAGPLLVLAPGKAHAQDAPAGSALQRLSGAANACGLDASLLQGLERLERLGPAEQAALRRLVDDVEVWALTWEDCDEAEDRLRAAVPLLRRTVEALPPDGTSAQAKAKEILARPEFVPLPERREKDEVVDEDSEGGLWARFVEWLRELLERDPKSPPPPNLGAGLGMGLANMIAVALLALVAVGVGILIYLALRNREPTSEELQVEQTALDAAVADPDNALSRPPEGWASLADELAAQGRFRDAVRSLYLALLSRLHRVGAIDYDPTQSNWDYTRRFRGRREWLPTFKDLTHRFDFAWYGVAEVERDGYLAFRDLTKPLLKPAPGEQGRLGGDARA